MGVATLPERLDPKLDKAFEKSVTTGVLVPLEGNFRASVKEKGVEDSPVELKALVTGDPVAAAAAALWLSNRPLIRNKLVVFKEARYKLGSV